MPELDELNLRVVGRSQIKTRVERQEVGRAFSKLEDCIDNIARCLAPLHSSRRAQPSWESLKAFLAEEHPKVHRQFPLRDNDDFELVGRHPFDIWLAEGHWKKRTDVKEEIIQHDTEALTQQAEVNVHSVPAQRRRELALAWLSSSRHLQADRVFSACSGAQDYQKTIDDVHGELHRRALMKADVIGVTTTGLARQTELLQRVRCKVVVCEEAGEVMEPHMAASALLPGVEHLIQIGDHRQLRPGINNFSLSMESSSGKDYQLDRSQFERRAVGEPGMAPAPVAQLNVQRRMRPEISALIKNIYPQLEDHPTVMNYPNVTGVGDNVYWLDHKKEEDGADKDDLNQKSHSNEWEVGMIRAFVRHLVRQGTYRAEDIAVLTPYTGQLQKLRAALQGDFQLFLSDRDEDALAADGFDEGDSDVETNDKLNSDSETTRITKTQVLEKKALADSLRLATVDNFQGEEAKVVLVSLVRSNPQQRVGFLRTENRINVLVSRAKHGLFLLGNAETYRNVPMWARIYDQLDKAAAVGSALRIVCPRHVDLAPMLCSNPGDFERYSPEGGCLSQCDRRLDDCGHRCQSKCHAEQLHKAFVCPKPCARRRATCVHACIKLCGEDCGKCLVRLDGIRLRCGHIQKDLACHYAQDVEKLFCIANVVKKVPKCGHDVVVKCSTDVTADSFACFASCDQLLSCGHPCPGSCDECSSVTDQGQLVVAHQKCSKTCERPHATCNHFCQKPCHDGQGCGVCEQACQVLFLGQICFWN